MNIYYDNRNTGQGKSYDIVNYIQCHIEHNKLLMLVPNISNQEDIKKIFDKKNNELKFLKNAYFLNDKIMPTNEKIDGRIAINEEQYEKEKNNYYGKLAEFKAQEIVGNDNLIIDEIDKTLGILSIAQSASDYYVYSYDTAQDFTFYYKEDNKYYKLIYKTDRLFFDNLRDLLKHKQKHEKLNFINEDFKNTIKDIQSLNLAQGAWQITDNKELKLRTNLFELLSKFKNIYLLGATKNTLVNRYIAFLKEQGFNEKSLPYEAVPYKQNIEIVLNYIENNDYQDNSLVIVNNQASATKLKKLIGWRKNIHIEYINNSKLIGSNNYKDIKNLYLHFDLTNVKPAPCHARNSYLSKIGNFGIITDDELNNWLNNYDYMQPDFNIQTKNRVKQAIGRVNRGYGVKNIYVLENSDIEQIAINTINEINKINTT